MSIEKYLNASDKPSRLSDVKVYLLTLVTAASILAPAAHANPEDVFADEPIVAAAQPATGWASLAIVNIEAFPWDKPARFGARTKTIFKGPEVGQLVYSIFPPTWNAEMPKKGILGNHYHPYWEWGYTLKGDSTLAEPVSPYQKNGMLYRKREGGWLTRPPYSMHGGVWETGGKRAQLPYHLLIFEEGDGSVVTVGEDGDHFFLEYPDRKPDPYLPDWKSVKKFTRPWLVDSIRDLEWETDPNVPGRFVKWLDDDPQDGFRAQLIKVPPGWQPPANVKGSYFEKANRLRYVIYGEMNVWLFEDPDDSKPQSVKVSEDYFIYQPARSIWGYGAGGVSELGAVWLEVTYATGVEHGGGPIEEPTLIKQ